MYDERDADDDRLLAAGDHARLMARYRTQIEARVRARVGGPAADDVVQNVFLRLWRELDRGRRYTVPYRVVVHHVTGWAILDHFAREKRLPPPVPLDLDLPDGSSEIELPDEMEPLLAELTDLERAVFELRALEGLSAKQVAAELDMKPNAVDQAYDRAKRRLRRRLAA